MSPNVVLYYRNAMHKDKNHCHIGLGVNTSHTVKVLRAAGIQADTVGIWDAHDIHGHLVSHPDPTHVVIEAPFIGGIHVKELVNEHKDKQFICRCHSQISFLQVEAGAINLIRQYINLQHEVFNFEFSCNNLRTTKLFQDIYNCNVVYLPNLYYINPHSKKPHKVPSKLLRIGSFGALRLQKNHIGAAAAAMLIAKKHGFDLEFYINVNREEHGKGVLQAIRNMFSNIPWAKLVEVPWMPWVDFQRYIGILDLHMQVSMSETFNITSADAASNMVPTVVSSAIDWAPRSWEANIDDPEEIAEVGWNLISSPFEAQKGLINLQNHVKEGFGIWKDYLDGNNADYNTYIVY